MTAELFESMRLRDKKFRIAKQNKKPKKWEEARTMRNSVNEACKNAKDEFVKGKLKNDV